MTQLQNICIGFTTYRTETLTFVEKLMQDYEVIALEEPKTPGFSEMLQGKLSIEEYLMLTDFEFVRFAYNSCKIFQRLYKQGKKIVQVDPFMDELVRIHEFFAAGGSPQRIQEKTITRDVYDCEHYWTKKLIDFYKRSVKGHFDRLVKAVQEFARVDAKKVRKRNKMRAKEIINLFLDFKNIYVEAGYIHFPLIREISAHISKSIKLKTKFIMEPVVRSLSGKKQILAPGDVLTLLYAFHSEYAGEKADILAAQSLIYNKVVNKEELLADDSEMYPHIKDEIEAVSLASSLSYEQCRKIFFQIRHLSTSEARMFLRQWREKNKN